MWNALLADHEARYRLWKANPFGPVPSFCALSQRSVALQQGARLHGAQGDTDPGFLQDYSMVCLRYTAQYLADAHTGYFQAKKEAEARGAELPIRKSKRRTVDSTNPQDVRLDSTCLHIPKIGWVRLSGAHQYLGCQARQARVVQGPINARLRVSCERVSCSRSRNVLARHAWVGWIIPVCSR